MSSLASNSSLVMLTFLHEQSQPQRLSATGLYSSCGDPSYEQKAHVLAHSHTHTHTQAGGEYDATSCSISILADINYRK